jgi:PleD family two-component response regulator
MGMTTPLALMYYQNLLPGSQLVNRLQDLGYRVVVVGDARDISSRALAEKPMVFVSEISADSNITDSFRQVRENPATEHIPILAYSTSTDEHTQAAAVKAGANLVASEAGILDQLPRLLDQVLTIP